VSLDRVINPGSMHLTRSEIHQARHPFEALLVNGCEQLDTARRRTHFHVEIDRLRWARCHFKLPWIRENGAVPSLVRQRLPYDADSTDLSCEKINTL